VTKIDLGNQLVAGSAVDFSGCRSKKTAMHEAPSMARRAVRNDGVMREVIDMASASVITARSAGDATQDMDAKSVSAVVPKID
jgi:hypothetical protein